MVHRHQEQVWHLVLQRNKKTQEEAQLQSRQVFQETGGNQSPNSGCIECYSNSGCKNIIKPINPISLSSSDSE